ncbi:MAG: SDR family NAD(P)-dependent oxidoreductase [Sandaracinaceae bacterium]|nr:SDR family NAD(P)-dependent oxidoreductase [Sandaracinaceae bacterium]
MSLAGKRVAVTGANTGVGRATAEALAAEGAEVVLVCRSAARARAALDAVGARGSLVVADLASLESVREAARVLSARPLDALVLNAAVAGARGLTADGFELAFGTNHLGHFLLARLLEPALALDARVVHLGSGAHERVRALDLDALARPTRSRTGVAEYAVSKLCVMLFHQELARRFEGTGRRSVAADPGDVASEAYRNVPCLVRWLVTARMKPPSEGARPTRFCLGSERAQNGRLYDANGERAPSLLARDAALAAALWARSEAWTGLRALGPLMEA